MTSADTSVSRAVLARARGCLMGQVAGDALGSLVEFETAEAIRARHPKGVNEMAVSPMWGTLPGQPTDDSELALLLARSIVERGGYDSAAAAAAYAWWMSSPPFDIGGTTSQALSAAARNPAAPEAAARKAASPSSQANGSLMRISPIGVLGWASPSERVADWARADSELTHPHSVCQEACAVFTVAIAEAIARGGPAERIYERALLWCDEHGREPAVTQILRNAREGPPSVYYLQMGWVRIALQNAFFQLLTAPDTGAAIRDTVMRGGDTDTNGAIVGALCGAVHGLDSIPPSWRNAVLSCRPERGNPGVQRPRPERLWPVDVLELADELVKAGAA